MNLFPSRQIARAIYINSSRENCKLVLLRIQHFCKSLTHLQASLGGYFWQKHVVWGKAGLLCLPDNATNKKEDLFHLANKDVHWVHFHSSAKVKNGCV